jgi:alpha-methylacyl-CoA racemase
MGPLQDVKVVELGGIGPVPFAGMLLSDLGATVVRVDRVGSAGGSRVDEPLLRGRRSIAIDLKQPAGRDLVLRLAAGHDALIEGFRPGVTERLGLGPDDCLVANPALVYGRMTGWGQDGPLAPAAGHDVNYVALAGVLDMIGPADGPPTVPLNLVGDFGGGGMLLALGVVSAVLEARSSGRGQIVDTAMVDGAALLSTMMHGFLAQGLWTTKRGSNVLDGGAPFYGVYEASDGGYLTIGAIEPEFYRELVTRLGLTDLPAQYDKATWDEARDRLVEVFGSRPLAHWQEVLEGTDACFAPVLSIEGAARHPHNLARGTFVEVAGIRQPAPAPRFSRTPADLPEPPPEVGSSTSQILAELGLGEKEVAELQAEGIVA